MRWIIHLMGAAIVGMFVVVIWEQFSGVSISQRFVEAFSKVGIGPGLMIAVLVVLTFALWAKSSSG